MTPGEFAAKWQGVETGERQSAQSHFLDLRRTLTNLYNERPTWLADAHRDLDTAVLAAYGWPADLPDEAILERLLELNLSREAVSP